MVPHSISSASVAIIGGGPAGLMAAEVIAQAGIAVSIYDAMPSLGRKFLLAGVGGMNITHAETYEKFITRYARAKPNLKPYIDNFSPDLLRRWIHNLGIDTFTGTSGRVFPKDMKAAPLLRAWLHRLRSLGVHIYPRHRWLGWNDDGTLRISSTDEGSTTEKKFASTAIVLALGGASWPRLGSDGSWVELLRAKNIEVAQLLPANCGFETAWSTRFQQEYAGTPLQTLHLSVVDKVGTKHSLRGEAMISSTGIEGTSIYALSAVLRDLIIAHGSAELSLDLLPDLSLEKIIAQLQKPRGKNSISNFLRKQFNFSPVKIALLRELTPVPVWHNPEDLARVIKGVNIILKNYRPIEEAISSAGGVVFAELNEHLMLQKLPGVFCAGEMLDWEAPTGGYLLTACFATGQAAGQGVVRWLDSSCN